MLHNQEITLLIRDTEPHERGLFSVDPSIKSGRDYSNDSRRKTGHNEPSHSSAIARVLGGDMLRKLQSSSTSHRSRGVDVEVLLQGAEKLNSAYEVAGTGPRIAKIRAKYEGLSSSIKHYEERVLQQQASLSGTGFDDGGNEYSHRKPIAQNEDGEQELHQEESIVKELQARKLTLEARLAEMERELGGLRR